MSSPQKSFASDNYAGIHPDILKAIADANQGAAPDGADSYTQQAIEKFKEHFGISAQFIALLSDDLWRKNAAHANLMTQKLFSQIKSISKITVTQLVQANAIFAKVPSQYIPLLQKQYAFYVWNEETNEVRWMTSFATLEKDVDDFARLIRDTV